MTDAAPEHVDIRGDPPVIAGLEKLRGIASFRIGSRMYVHAVEQIDSGTYAAYLGVSMPTDTSEGAGRGEITFLNYAPVGAMYAHAVTIDGDQYYEIDLPNRDEISAAIRARERHENDHRAAVIPPVVNELENWIDSHADRDDVLHRGIALGFEAARRELVARRDAAYTGSKRWSRDGIKEVFDRE